MPWLMSDRPWEIGSDFSWPDLVEEPEQSWRPWSGESRLYGSGRDALRGLLAHGRDQLGWRRVFVPSYFCQDVIQSMLDTSLDLIVYYYSPFDHPDQFSTSAFPAPETPCAGDAVLLVNTFGMHAAQPEWEIDDEVAIIEDHTHAPLSVWARQSTADWGIISVRKVFPLPDGGVVWSPVQHDLPEKPAASATHHKATADRLMGMVLKDLYLKGLPIDKDAFRSRFIMGERSIASGQIAAISPVSEQALPLLPAESWHARRTANFHSFRTALDELKYPGIERLLEPVTVFGIVLLFNTKRLRDVVRQELIDFRVYPALLWELNTAVSRRDISAAHRDQAERSLFIHCDHRYDSEDMIRLAHLLNRIISKDYERFK